MESGSDMLRSNLQMTNFGVWNDSGIQQNFIHLARVNTHAIPGQLWRIVHFAVSIYPNCGQTVDGRLKLDAAIDRRPFHQPIAQKTFGALAT